MGGRRGITQSIGRQTKTPHTLRIRGALFEGRVDINFALEGIRMKEGVLDVRTPKFP